MAESKSEKFLKEFASGELAEGSYGNYYAVKFGKCNLLIHKEGTAGATRVSGLYLGHPQLCIMEDNRLSKRGRKIVLESRLPFIPIYMIVGDITQSGIVDSAGSSFLVALGSEKYVFLFDAGYAEEVHIQEQISSYSECCTYVNSKNIAKQLKTDLDKGKVSIPNKQTYTTGTAQTDKPKRILMMLRVDSYLTNLNQVWESFNGSREAYMFKKQSKYKKYNDPSIDKVRYFRAYEGMEFPKLEVENELEFLFPGLKKETLYTIFDTVDGRRFLSQTFKLLNETIKMQSGISATLPDCLKSLHQNLIRARKIVLTSSRYFYSKYQKIVPSSENDDYGAWFRTLGDTYFVRGSIKDGEAMNSATAYTLDKRVWWKIIEYERDLSRITTYERS